MWRSFFLAVGIIGVVVGLEAMTIDSVSLYTASGTDAQSFIDPTGRPSETVRQWKPSEWFPWMAMMVGAVVIIYAVSLPKRFAREG